jgi:hypothetical protein
MWKTRIVASTVFLGLSLGPLVPQFALRASVAEGKSKGDRATLIGFVRTINTAEAGEFAEHGAYASWLKLLAHQSEYLNEWLTRWKSLGKTTHFSESPEVLPGWTLKLVTQTDGKGYVLLLEDVKDKTGYAAVSDERAMIRECEYIR